MKEKITKESILIFIIGLFIGILVMLIFYPERIAKLENGEEVIVTVSNKNITADELFDDLKTHYASSSLLDLIDTTLFDEKYKSLSDEEIEEIESSVNNYLLQYEEAYGKSEKDILKMIGFDEKEEFIDYMTLDYKRSKAYKEYLINNLTDEEIEDFYETSVFETSKVKHILVKNSDMTTTESYNLANEIIKKLNKGESWDDLVSEYESSIKEEEFEVDFYDSIESEFLDAVANLEEEKYTKVPVSTSYGYHVIYKISGEEKPSLEDSKDNIKNALIIRKANEDSNLYEKTLIEIRKEENLEIKDTNLKKVYDNYVESYSE